MQYCHCIALYRRISNRLHIKVKLISYIVGRNNPSEVSPSLDIWNAAPCLHEDCFVGICVGKYLSTGCTGCSLSDFLLSNLAASSCSGTHNLDPTKIPKMYRSIYKEEDKMYTYQLLKTQQSESEFRNFSLQISFIQNKNVQLVYSFLRNKTRNLRMLTEV